MSYEIRTKDGMLLAQLTNKSAGEMIDALKGEWTTKNFKIGGKTNVYELTDGGSSQASMSGIRWFIQPGSYLCKV